MRQARIKGTDIVLLMILAIWIGGVEHAQAQQSYPTKAIEIIVPFAAGGGTDMSARVMADYLSKKWGKPVNVVNKPGGNTIPALLELYKAPPDGYTLFQDGMPSSSVLQVTVRDLPFKVMDRTFIGMITASPLIYLVPADSPIKTLKDVEAEAKRDPSNFTWTSTGNTGGYFIAMRKFIRAIGVDIMKTKPVTTKGGSEAVALLTAGAAKVGFGTPSAAGPAIAGKMVRPLAITSTKRLSSFPEIPTIIEAGYSTAVQQDPYGPSGPPKLPSRIIEAWEKTLQEMVKDPEVISKFDRLGLIPQYLNSRDTKELVLKQIEEMKELWGVK